MYAVLIACADKALNILMVGCVVGIQLDAVFKKKESISSAEGANADADENGVTEADKCELQLQEKYARHPLPL